MQESDPDPKMREPRSRPSLAPALIPLLHPLPQQIVFGYLLCFFYALVSVLETRG